MDELSTRVAMSARNIRAHQSRGLIPQPERRGRFAYYGPAHERALLRIKALQDEGYNLAAIERMLADELDREAELQRVVLSPLLAEEEFAITRAEMGEMFGVTRDVRRLEMALSTGLLRDLGDGRYATPSRQLLEAAAALMRDGMSILDIYEMQLQIMSATRDVARRFVEACLRASAGPGDLNDTDSAAVQRRFEALRDQFTLVLVSTFAANVRRASEEVLARESRAR